LANIELTVLLATRNGGTVLSRVLAAYMAVAREASNWQLIVVDNGSEDDTALILRSFQSELPLEVLEVAEPGKNRALNAGLAAAEGRFIVLTDDDAVPSPSFVAAWSRCARARTDYDLFGGTIEPLFDLEPPRWLVRNQESAAMLFARSDLREGPVSWARIYGGNMAVRKRIFDEGFRFNESLGPNGADPFYPMGSESEFCRRVSQSGAKSWFAAEPKVWHIVRASQLQPEYWAARAYRSGRGRAFFVSTDSAARAESWRMRVRTLAGRVVGWDWLKAVSPFPAHRFDSLCRRNFRRGFRDEMRRRVSSDLGRRGGDGPCE
jgi:glycosyltransferase involved in cell wall biosynthesis